MNFTLLEVPRGTQIRLTYGNTWDKDTAVAQGGIATGLATDKTSILVAANMYIRRDIYARDRDVSKNADVRLMNCSAAVLFATRTAVIAACDSKISR